MRFKKFVNFLNESWERESSFIFRGGIKFDITHGGYIGGVYVKR